ncbi:hypothetical protein LZ30DRAFT_695635 [Colletotrichum cereale]|nr:hypothetical protein LZ30DRAFT_695635 [Colletotrichum cereale]
MLCARSLLFLHEGWAGSGKRQPRSSCLRTARPRLSPFPPMVISSRLIPITATCYIPSDRERAPYSAKAHRHIHKINAVLSIAPPAR